MEADDSMDGSEESNQSKRGLRTRPLLLSRLSAMRPPW
jgi:hypothetical protein